MHAATCSHLSGRGPTDVDDAPAPACFSKSDMMMGGGYKWCRLIKLYGISSGAQW